MEKEVEREVRITSGVTFQKRIVSADPDAYAEVNLNLRDCRKAGLQSCGTYSISLPQR